MDVFLAHFENPTGTLIGGQPCSKFASMGAQCSLYIEACVTMDGLACSLYRYEIPF